MHDPISKYIEEQMLAANTGLQLDQLKVVATLLIAYPLAFLQTQLPRNATLQHVYCLVTGLAIGWFLIGYELLHSFLSALICYLVMKFVDRRYSHIIVFIGMMGYLVLVCHGYRMYIDYMGWKQDFTGPQMLLTLKMTAMAFNLHDGAREQDESQLDSYQQKYRLARLPGLLEFFGFVYCYLGFYTGPVVEFREYDALCDGSMFAVSAGSKSTRRSGELPSGRLYATLQPLLVAFGSIGFGMWIESNYTRSYVTDPNQFGVRPLHERAFIMWCYSVSLRMTYYFAWKLAEGACNLSGLGYSGDDADGTPQYARCTNAHVWQVESAMNVKTVTDGWNLGTDRWLKHYIYARVKKTAFKNYDVLLTLLTSAVWHGLYPGYYMSFMTAALLINVARLGRRVCRPRFMADDGKTPGPLKPLYDVVTFIAHQFVFNYTMIPFVLLSFTDGLAFWKSMHFGGHIVLVVGLVVLTLAGGNKRSSSAKAKPSTTASAKTTTAHNDTPMPRKTRSATSGEKSGSTSPYSLRKRK